jgi:hypothetical protein
MSENIVTLEPSGEHFYSHLTPTDTIETILRDTDGRVRYFAGVVGVQGLMSEERQVNRRLSGQSVPLKDGDHIVFSQS